MHKFQGKQSLPKLNNEEIVCLNRTTSIKEIESVIKNLPTNKSPELGDFTGEFHQTFEEELISIIFKINMDSIVIFVFPEFLVPYSVYHLPKHFLKIKNYC